MDKELKNGVQVAVREAGTQAALADKLGVSQQVISRWLRRGWVPLQRSREIETLYGIPRKKLMNPRVLDLVDTAADFEA